ncbi:hypothetical protein IKP85_02535 [bacterium]|nr:hypothetical protein [bacterium]
MQWFQVKEQSAGKKRLILTWYLYKIFGKKMLHLIAFLVAFFTFVFSSKIREYSKKYFKITENKTGIKPSLGNEFRHIYSYANSLADKILVYCGDFDTEQIIFENDNDKAQLLSDIESNNGVFFICDHIGNIEVMQALFLNEATQLKHNVNIFMSNKQSQIFNDFLRSIKKEFPVRFFPVEDIGLTTGIELKENLEKGEVVFIAGDRLAQNNDTKSLKAKLFSKDILLPKGTFKLAKLMDVPVYYISAVKIGKQYKIYLEKQNSLNEKDMITSYTNYLEKIILKNPFQFFHFYDFFN